MAKTRKPAIELTSGGTSRGQSEAYKSNFALYRRNEKKSFMEVFDGQADSADENPGRYRYSGKKRSYKEAAMIDRRIKSKTRPRPRPKGMRGGIGRKAR